MVVLIWSLLIFTDAASKGNKLQTINPSTSCQRVQVFSRAWRGAQAWVKAMGIVMQEEIYSGN